MTKKGHFYGQLLTVVLVELEKKRENVFFFHTFFEEEIA